MNSGTLAYPESPLLRRRRDSRSARPVFAPAASVQETDAQFTLRMPIEFVDPAQLRVSVKDSVLSISGTDKRNNLPFRRSFALPAPVAENSLLVHLDTHTLTVSINKREAYASSA